VYGNRWRNEEGGALQPDSLSPFGTTNRVSLCIYAFMPLCHEYRSLLFSLQMSLQDFFGQTIENLDSTATMSGQPPSSIVPEEPDPTLPTLPPDFPEHLLLQICDAILQPALSPYSPVRPHARPWIRASPARAPCKSDLLALCYANKRLYAVCSDQIYRHIRVATLAVADMFVSRRNLLRNTS